jgi:glycosyltransferase involved in cell wall biosynthesis
VHYVGISNFLKDTLTKKIGFKKDNIFIIPNGIDIASFLDLSPITQEFFSRNKLLESELLILLPSKIMKNKNVHICIEVISQLKKKIPSVKLVITGKNFPHGKYLDYLKNTYSQIKNLDLENNVVLVSFLFTQKKHDATFDLVKSLYRLSDLVFFFSSYENFGLPLIEAGITKTPIICNNLKVFKEIENMNLYFVDIKKDTSSDMANKVLDILDHNRQVAYFRKIKINYSFETIFLKKIIPLIDKL